jgi:hypothetical protein
MEDGELYGEDLLNTVNAVSETVKDLHRFARNDRDNVNMLEESGQNDKDTVKMMMRKLPKAFNELGNMLEEAREIDRYLGQVHYTSDSVYGPSRAGDDFSEEKFLNSYREAEEEYRNMFRKLRLGVEGENLPEYLEEEYDLSLQDALPEMPEPRPEKR